MVSAGVSLNGKTEIFFIDPQKTKVSQKKWRITLTFWRRPCCQNTAVSIQTLISSSCNTALRHTAPKQLKIFSQTTPDLNTLDYSVWDILKELVCRMLSETNGMLMTRQWEKLFCSGKGWSVDYCDGLGVACVRATTWITNRFQTLFYDM